MKPSRPAPHYTLAWMTSCLVWASHGQALADTDLAQAQGLGASTTESVSAPLWQELTPAQQQVLTPLASQWHTLDEASQAKWLRVAKRFDQMSPDKQARVQARMHHWAQLTPQQRAEARLRFQQTRQLSAEERRRKWAAYQALSEEDRQDLGRQAVRKAQPIYLPSDAVGPREAKQAYDAKRRPFEGVPSEKSNMVPATPPAMLSTRTPVSPAIVNATTGATTNLVNQRPEPPLHQQTGMPKIAATEGFVDPVTLLPQKGAQGAAMAKPDPARARRLQRRE